MTKTSTKATRNKNNIDSLLQYNMLKTIDEYIQLSIILDSIQSTNNRNMGSSAEQNNSEIIVKPTTDQDKHQLEPPMSSSSFSEYVTRLVTGRLSSKRVPNDNKIYNNNMTESDKDARPQQPLAPPQADIPGAQRIFSNPSSEVPRPQPQLSLSLPLPAPSPQPPSPWPKRSCRAPISRKFAHPCTCGQSNSHHKFLSAPNNSTGHLPPAAYTSPLHLYDPHTKKCLPTSRNRDMLLKECHSHAINTFPLKPHQSSPCVYDDLVCDARRNRCACKPPLHLYYESNLTSFGCVPIGLTGSQDGRVNCRSGYVYNLISKDCQKIFDINELPPNYTTGVSATQFSFVTIVLIWILLLILIVTAKLRKLRTSNLYRNSPTTERRSHSSGGGGGSNSYRNQSQNASTWLHPFIAAVNGHHHLNGHRTTVDRHGQTLSLDESGNYNDTDFFLSNGNLRINDILNDNNFVGSQQSLNNPPPKFEEIYPSCPDEQEAPNFRPPSNEDLPSYDEAMKLQNTSTTTTTRSV